MSVLAAIGVLALLIVVHELGHFAAARLQGIYVNRFSLGFGPVLLKYQGAMTEYAVRAFPLGGYVGFPDDDPESEIPANDPNLLRNRPVLDRAIVISAGVIANLVFAYFLLVGQVATVGFQEIQAGLVISQVQPGSAAMAAGIQVGDLIQSLEDQTLPAYPQATEQFIQTVTISPGRPLTVQLQRDGETLNATLTPQVDPQGEGKIGVALVPHIQVQRANNIFEALSKGANAYERVVKLTVQGFWQLISNFSESAAQVAGPVKIVEYGASIAQSNLGNLFQFGALISINLAVINILPLPALDGGQLLFLLIEGLFGKPLPNKIQEGIMQTGLVLLLGLGVVLIVRDTVNLAIVQEFFR
jgi:membrane-associated protease RseP (regulator of RpoE activity)